MRLLLSGLLLVATPRALLPSSQVTAGNDTGRCLLKCWCWLSQLLLVSGCAPDISVKQLASLITLLSKAVPIASRSSVYVQPTAVAAALGLLEQALTRLLLYRLLCFSAVASKHVFCPCCCCRKALRQFLEILWLGWCSLMQQLLQPRSLDPKLPLSATERRSLHSANEAARGQPAGKHGPWLITQWPQTRNSAQLRWKKTPRLPYGTHGRTHFSS